MKRVFIKGGTIVNSKECYVGDILIEDEKISKILKSGETIKLDADTKIIDAGGKLVFPGFIDAHTHFDLHVAGTVTCDNFYSGTRAAISGGTTVIIDFGIRGKPLMKEWIIGLQRLKTVYSVTMVYICPSVIGMKRQKRNVRI